jgi:hypothetical protein
VTAPIAKKKACAVPERERLEEVSMVTRLARIAALVLVAGVPALALAGAPDPENRKNVLRHLCQSGPLAGEVCDPTGNDCDTKPNGDPYECVLDVLKRPVLRGTLTVVADENPDDNVSLPGNPVINAVLEIKLKGKTYLFAKSFQSSAPGSWPEIGAWNPPFSEGVIQQLETSWPYQQPLLALTAFEDAIEEMTEAVWPGLFDLTGRSPAILDAVPFYADGKAVDQFTTGDVGRVVRLKVRIQYVSPV